MSQPQPQPQHRLLSSHAHYCFHSPRCNVHQYPDLYRCAKGAAHAALVKVNQAAGRSNRCTASIHLDMAKQAGLVDDKGNVSCPLCGGATTLVLGKTRAEVHAKLCTDETIHYPEMHKAGKLSAADFQAWKATLTRAELMGHYKRTPDIPLMASFTHDETALMTSNLPAFNELLQARLRDRAEAALLHQVPYRHSTVSSTITL